MLITEADQEAVSINNHHLFLVLRCLPQQLVEILCWVTGGIAA